MYDTKYFQAQLDKSDEKVEYQYGRLLDLVGELPPHARVLDAGCGAGPALRYLDQHGMTPYGCDLIEYPLVQAHRFVPDARLVRCDADSPLPFGTGSFHVVLMSEVIEHVADPGAALRECYRVLCPGGAVALTTPNLWDARRAYYPLLGKVWSGDADATHRTLFNPQTLRAHLEEAGYLRVRVRAGFKPMRWISSRKLSIRRSLPGLPFVGNTLVGVGFKAAGDG
jgi:2-polyprenyl-3-methyl-5-hydroxy-6-metoxy-1,4-benzoquinol methylase